MSRASEQLRQREIIISKVFKTLQLDYNSYVSNRLDGSDKAAKDLEYAENMRKEGLDIMWAQICTDTASTDTAIGPAIAAFNNLVECESTQPLHIDDATLVDYYKAIGDLTPKQAEDCRKAITAYEALTANWSSIAESISIGKIEGYFQLAEILAGVGIGTINNVLINLWSSIDGKREAEQNAKNEGRTSFRDDPFCAFMARFYTHEKLTIDASANHYKFSSRVWGILSAIYVSAAIPESTIKYFSGHDPSDQTKHVIPRQSYFWDVEIAIAKALDCTIENMPSLIMYDRKGYQRMHAEVLTLPPGTDSSAPTTVPIKTESFKHIANAAKKPHSIKSLALKKLHAARRATEIVADDATTSSTPSSTSISSPEASPPAATEARRAHPPRRFKAGEGSTSPGVAAAVAGLFRRSSNPAAPRPATAEPEKTTTCRHSAERIIVCFDY